MDLLSTLHRFHTAQEIHTLLTERGTPVGLATVYRNLQSMVEDGTVDVVRASDGQLTYRVCSPGHHHHLFCRKCGRTVEVDLDGVEELLLDAAKSHGFFNISHELELYGVCELCHTTR
jgi:Fur family ferric uptake transcriptional regulator